MESKLMEWIADRRQQGIGISIVEVRLQVKLMAKSEPSAASFKASYGWAHRFIERNNLSVRRRTTLAQRLLADHDAKLLEFQQFVIQLNDVNLATIQSLLDSDSDDGNTFEGFR